MIMHGSLGISKLSFYATVYASSPYTEKTDHIITMVTSLRVDISF
jgi:hypothetical protein